MLNRVLLIGNLGAAPELRYTQSQLPVCNFRIATNEKRQENGQWVDHTEWHTIVTFGKTAENCNQYLQKGKQCFVEGRIQTRKYQDQDGKDKYFTEIIASNVRFLGGKGEGIEVERSNASRPSSSSGQGTGTTPPPPIGETISFDDDDIPF